MKKRLFGLLLTLSIMIVSLAACGTKENKPKDGGNQEGQVQNNDGNDSSAKKFYIGGIGPITGGAAVYGQHVMNAAQIAVDETAAGGITVIRLEFRFEDDARF